MSQYISVVPAYGVLLKTEADVLAHWNAEKDFMIIGCHPDAGRYIAKHEAEKHGLKLECRYAFADRKVMILG